jgi:hypothetical protein
MKDLRNNHVSLFLVGSPLLENRVWVGDRLAIKRIMWRGKEDRQRIIFQAFAKDIGYFDKELPISTLAVYYMEEGPLDDFRLGKLVCLINNIQFTDAWINRLSILDWRDQEFVMFHMYATGKVDWHLNGYRDIQSGLVEILVGNTEEVENVSRNN